MSGADTILEDYGRFRALNSALNETTDQSPPRLRWAGKPPPRLPPAFTINLELFSLGYLKDSKFVPGFNTELGSGSMTLDLDNEKPELSMKLGFPESLGDTQYPVLHSKSNIQDIENIFYKEDDRMNDSRCISLTVVLRRPPQFHADWRPYLDSKGRREKDAFRRATEDDWNPLLMTNLREHPVSVLPRHSRREALLKLGLWTVYRCTSILSSQQRKEVRVSLDRLRTFERRDEFDEFREDTDVVLDQDIKIYKARISATLHTIEDYLAREFKDDFESQYLILGLISQGKLPPHHDSVGNLQHRVKFKTNRHTILSALYRLDHLKDSQMEKQVRNIELGKEITGTLPEGRIYMRKVIVTPTRMILQPTIIETANRVVAHWTKKSKKFNDMFMRVSFEDEDGRLNVNFRLQQSDNANPRTGIIHRIRAALKYGIHIGKRHYVFLASSESQLKERACWMVCEVPEEGFTADAIRQSMGDFSHLRIVSKYACRMGLCFSATRSVSMDFAAHKLDEIEHEYHVGKGNGRVETKTYTYTDGIGRCSEALAAKCAKALTGEHGIVPSAIQMRYRGYKGVLAVHRGLDPNVIELRPSMKKFTSALGFGVMKISTHSHAHLNRQAISLLSHLGVKDEVFMTRMKAQIASIKNITLYIHQLDNRQHFARKMYRSSDLPILQMVRAGFTKEPLLVNVLKCLECHLLQNLKYKARIQVEEGGFLMGVADEYNVLGPGEIFVAIQPPGGERKVISGPCLLFRNPCLHPGDIQTATAVDVPLFSDPELGHLPTNVVMFSTARGERDLPSKLSGGDLDGDFFTVIWDPDFMINPREPMCYEPAKPEPLSEGVPITMEDVQNFIIDYMKSDVLGIVSTTHLARSDKRTPFHDDCIQLAQLASDAVDFAKSGVPVMLPEKLMGDRERPDFLSHEGNARNAYKSEKVLGKMFRLIEPPPVLRIDPEAYYPLDARLMMTAVPHKYLREAGLFKHSYDIQLESEMRKHRMNEIELWAGVNISGDGKKRKERDSEVKGPIREAVNSLISRFRKEAGHWMAKQNDINGSRLWALAAYRVTRDKRSQEEFVNVHNESMRGSSVGSFSGGARGGSRTGRRSSSVLGGAMGENEDEDELEEGEIRVTRVPLISFPWLWAQELCDAVSGQVTIKEEPEDEEELDQRLYMAREEDLAASRITSVGYIED